MSEQANPKAGQINLPPDIVALIDNMVEFEASKWRDCDSDTWIHPPFRSPGEYVALRGNTALGASQIRFHIRQIVAIALGRQDAELTRLRSRAAEAHQWEEMAERTGLPLKPEGAEAEIARLRRVEQLAQKMLDEAAEAAREGNQ